MNDAPTPAPLSGRPGFEKFSRDPAQPRSANSIFLIPIAVVPISALVSQNASPIAAPARCPRTVCTPPMKYRSEEHTSELQSQSNLVCRLLLEKKKKNNIQ